MFEIYTTAHAIIWQGLTISMVLTTSPPSVPGDAQAIPALVSEQDTTQLPNPICAECRLGAKVSVAKPQLSTLTIEYIDQARPWFEGLIYVDAVLVDGTRHRVAARTSVVMQDGLDYDFELIEGHDWSWSETQRLEVILLAD